MEHPEHQEVREHRGRVEQVEVPEHLEHQEVREQVVVREHQEVPEHRDHQEHREVPEHRDHQEHQEPPEVQAHRVHRVHPVILGIVEVELRLTLLMREIIILILIRVIFTNIRWFILLSIQPSIQVINTQI